MTSKVGEFNECLLIEIPEIQWFSKGVAGLVDGRNREDPLFEFSQRQLAKAMQDAAKEIGLLPLPTLHKGRHSGASIDVALDRRSLKETKARGRLLSDQSLRRYAEGGRLTERLHRLPKKLQLEGLRAMGGLQNILVKSLAIYPYIRCSLELYLYM